MAILQHPLRSPLATVDRLAPAEMGTEAALRRLTDEVNRGIDVLTRLVPIPPATSAAVSTACSGD